MKYVGHEDVRMYTEDITAAYAAQVKLSGTVAWDIETSGLDWRQDRIGTCQLYSPNLRVAVVKIGTRVPTRLASLLADEAVRKIFHHAMFDLRFMSYHWGAMPKNVACTKIASKLLDANGKNNHSLKSLLQEYLGITIDKGEQRSNWAASKLSRAQIEYAASDVVYLFTLLQSLEFHLEKMGRLQLAHACFDHIPTRVSLDLLGYPDIYTY